MQEAKLKAAKEAFKKAAKESSERCWSPFLYLGEEEDNGEIMIDGMLNLNEAIIAAVTAYDRTQ